MHGQQNIKFTLHLCKHVSIQGYFSKQMRAASKSTWGKKYIEKFGPSRNTYKENKKYALNTYTDAEQMTLFPV
jgi:hypothetical protein